MDAPILLHPHPTHRMSSHMSHRPSITCRVRACATTNSSTRDSDLGPAALLLLLLLLLPPSCSFFARARSRCSKPMFGLQSALQGVTTADRYCYCCWHLSLLTGVQLLLGSASVHTNAMTR
jgi:hypothetical protein